MSFHFCLSTTRASARTSASAGSGTGASASAGEGACAGACVRVVLVLMIVQCLAHSHQCYGTFNELTITTYGKSN